MISSWDGPDRSRGFLSDEAFLDVDLDCFESLDLFGGFHEPTSESSGWRPTVRPPFAWVWMGWTGTGTGAAGWRDGGGAEAGGWRESAAATRALRAASLSVAASVFCIREEASCLGPRPGEPCLSMIGMKGLEAATFCKLPGLIYRRLIGCGGR